MIKKVDELVGSSISMRFVEISTGFDWMFMGVYSPCSLYNRHLFWEELFYVRSFWFGPWVIRGDFNVIRFVHEKNIRTRVTKSMRDFEAFIYDCSLHDCPMLNAKFIWTNDQDPPTLSKLDRILVTND